jgi:hypothetical protein
MSAPSFYGRPTGSSQATKFISFNCGSILPERPLSLRKLLRGSSSYWRSRYFRVLGCGIVLARAPSLGDRCFCSRTCSRNAVVLSKTGIAGCQEPGLVRDEAWSGIRSSACGCFHLFVSTFEMPGASGEIGSLPNRKPGKHHKDREDTVARG